MFQGGVKFQQKAAPKCWTSAFVRDAVVGDGGVRQPVSGNSDFWRQGSVVAIPVPMLQHGDLQPVRNLRRRQVHPGRLGRK